MTCSTHLYHALSHLIKKGHRVQYHHGTYIFMGIQSSLKGLCGIHSRTWQQSYQKWPVLPEVKNSNEYHFSWYQWADNMLLSSLKSTGGKQMFWLKCGGLPVPNSKYMLPFSHCLVGKLLKYTHLQTQPNPKYLVHTFLHTQLHNALTHQTHIQWHTVCTCTTHVLKLYSYM